MANLKSDSDYRGNLGIVFRWGLTSPGLPCGRRYPLCKLSIIIFKTWGEAGILAQALTALEDQEDDTRTTWIRSRPTTFSLEIIRPSCGDIRGTQLAKSPRASGIGASAPREGERQSRLVGPMFQGSFDLWSPRRDETNFKSREGIDLNGSRWTDEQWRDLMERNSISECRGITNIIEVLFTESPLSPHGSGLDALPKRHWPRAARFDALVPRFLLKVPLDPSGKRYRLLCFHGELVKGNFPSLMGSPEAWSYSPVKASFGFSRRSTRIALGFRSRRSKARKIKGESYPEGIQSSAQGSAAYPGEFHGQRLPRRGLHQFMPSRCKSM